MLVILYFVIPLIFRNFKAVYIKIMSQYFRTQGFPNPPPVNQPAFVTPPPPPPPSHSPSPERSEVDKHLMPPPPPPGDFFIYSHTHTHTSYHSC